VDAQAGDLVAHHPQALTIQRMVSARLPNAEGEFELVLYKTNHDEKEHLVLIYGDVKDQAEVPLRVHSECFTGDVLGSRRCDCGEQLHKAMQTIVAQGRGVVVYLRQEGRGIGLVDKLHAYNLQDQGYDTIDANLALGHQADERDYESAALMIKDLGIRSIQLITNNPQKIQHLTELGITITGRVSLSSTVYPDNEAYLRTKAERMQHSLSSPLLTPKV
jgi:GTP cyclohydrolase II